MDRAKITPHWRTYRLAQLFGWTITEIDAQPARRCDWLLAIADIDERVRAEAEAKQVAS